VHYLRKHLTLNHITNVSVIEAAVSANTGNSRFDAGDNASTGRLAATGTVDVSTTAIDSFVESSTYAPSLLKIDVEGAEVDVLHGALKTLNQLHPKILLATHSQTLKQTCVDLLVRSGYDIQELKDGAGATQSDELIAHHRDPRNPPTRHALAV
jgi:FkbM family methyltransferase